MRRYVNRSFCCAERNITFFEKRAYVPLKKWCDVIESLKNSVASVVSWIVLTCNDERV